MENFKTNLFDIEIILSPKGTGTIDEDYLISH